MPNQSHGKEGGESSRIRGLLQTVGGTAEPLLHTIPRISPEVVVFVCSEQTLATVVEVKRRIQAESAGDAVPQFKTVLTADPADLVACHCAAVEGLHWLREQRGLGRDEIRIDFTGGTKAMSAAVVLAAAPEGYRFCYVSGDERDKQGVGAVVTGTERLRLPENPWTILEEPDLRQLAVLASFGQWAAAADCAARLLLRSDEQTGPVFKALTKVLDGLRLWDHFEHEPAWRAWGKGAAVPQLVELAKVGNRPLVQQFAEKCQPLVGQLATVTNPARVEKSPPTPDAMVLDMLGNSGRQAGRGNYDEAALRCYRALELCAERRLRLLHKIDNGAVREQDVPEPLRSEFLQRKGPPRPPGWKLGLRESAELLAAKGCPLGKSLLVGLETNQLDSSARNQNWLIHGTQHVDESRFRQFRKCVLDAMGLTDAEIPSWPDFRP